MQIIAALKEWSKASRQRYIDVGHTAAEQHRDGVTDEQSRILDDFLAERATTLEGLMVKAGAIKSLFLDEYEIEAGDATDEQLMVSLVKDMLTGAVTA